MKEHERKVIEQFRSDYSSYILPNFDEYGAYRIIHKDAEQGDYRLVNYDSEGIFVTRNIDDDLDYEFEKPSDNDKIEELERRITVLEREYMKGYVKKDQSSLETEKDTFLSEMGDELHMIWCNLHNNLIESSIEKINGLMYKILEFKNKKD